MTSLVERLQRQVAEENVDDSGGICDACYGIQGAADDEFMDTRCDRCRRPLSYWSNWLDAHRGHLTPEQIEKITEVLLPRPKNEYRVRYWSVVLEQTLTTGLLTKAQAEFMAGNMRGTVLKEGE